MLTIRIVPKPLLPVLLAFCLSCIAFADDPVLHPAANSKQICPDTTLQITFASDPMLGTTGKIQIIDADTNIPADVVDVASETATQTIGGLPNFKYYPVIISGNQAAIHLHNGALIYGRTYYVTVDPTVFSRPGSSFAITNPARWTFTTRPAPPAADAARLTVSADNTGDFCSVQGAIDFVPANNTASRTIYIRNGVYTELIYLTNKHHLTFLGEDRQKTVIAYANNAKFNPASDLHTYHRGVFLANHCNDLSLRNLTIKNTTPQGGSQAEAIILKGDLQRHAILENVDLFSYQDTLQINGQAYITHCNITGDVDFMWGSGPCFFEDCHCTSLRSKAFYTQIRNPPTNHGYVYHHCLFDGAPGVTDMYLSRIAPATFPASEVVLIDCTLTDAVGSAGWLLNGAKGENPQQLITDSAKLNFCEFSSHHPDGSPIDTSKRLSVSRQLAQPADAKTIADYSDPTFVLGNNWNPTIKPAASTTSPSSNP